MQVSPPQVQRKLGFASAIFGHTSHQPHPSQSGAAAASSAAAASAQPSSAYSPPLLHSLWLHSLYNRLWRSGGGDDGGGSGSGGAEQLNHPGALYTTSKRRSILIQRCIDYVWYSPAALRPVTLLSIPAREQALPAFLPAANYPSDHLAIAGRFEWKRI